MILEMNYFPNFELWALGFFISETTESKIKNKYGTSGFTTKKKNFVFS